MTVATCRFDAPIDLLQPFLYETTRDQRFSSSSSSSAGVAAATGRATGLGVSSDQVTAFGILGDDGSGFLDRTSIAPR